MSDTRTARLTEIRADDGEALASLRKFAVTGGEWPGGSLAALQLALTFVDAARRTALLEAAEQIEARYTGMWDTGEIITEIRRRAEEKQS